MANYVFRAPTGDGWDNLARDEWFLDHLRPEDWILYFYVNENAVIIGRNQNPWRECNLTAMERDGVQLVRRITGGGAVFHDRGNLNFSFITGADRYDVEAQHEIILRAVRSFGIPCERSGRNDLLADGKKFSGNAFISRGRLRQHHGTLLISADLTRLQQYLNPDPLKLQAKGVTSVRARVTNLSALSPEVTRPSLEAAVRAAAAEVMGPLTDFVPTAEMEAQLAQYRAKQASWQWRLGKTPAFDASLSTRFDWGGVELLFTLQAGTVSAVQVYSDTLDPELAGQLQTRLTGCPFQSRALAAALANSSNPQMDDVARFLLEQGL